MAQSTCIRCNNTTFEIKNSVIRNAASVTPIKVFFFQCASCGGVIGIIPEELTKPVA